MSEPSALDSAGTRIARYPLRSEVRRVVLDRLLLGTIPPGAGINESELAASLGVSRTPLREALLSLEREGFLRSETGRGFYVVPLTARDAEELYPILWTLEAAALADSLPIGPERIVELQRINEELQRAGPETEEALRLDRLWHDTLLSGTRNRRLLDLIRALKEQARRYEYAYMRDAGRIVLSTRQHREILDALASGDRDGAMRCLERNWRVSLEFLVPWLSRGERGAEEHP